MKQTRLFLLTSIIFGATFVSFMPMPVYARESRVIEPLLQSDVVMSIENSASKRVQQAEERARNVVEHATHGLSRNNENSHNKRDHGESQKAKNEPKPEAKADKRNDKFDAAEIKKCENKQDMISSRLNEISHRGVKQLEVFHTIAKRVEAFYVQKQYTAPGYEELVTELDAVYDKSLIALTSTQNSGENWGCHDNNPLATLGVFTEAKRAEMALLAEYKDDVRELILLVKQSAGSHS